MPATFMLFLAALALAALSVVVLAGALYLILSKRRRALGAVILAGGCAGGLASVLLMLAVHALIDASAPAPPFESSLLVFMSGFGLAGGACAVAGLFLPWLRYDNRWAARRRG